MVIGLGILIFPITERFGSCGSIFKTDAESLAVVPCVFSFLHVLNQSERNYACILLHWKLNDNLRYGVSKPVIADPLPTSEFERHALVEISLACKPLCFNGDTEISATQG
jgi:hypothetical protein